MIPKAILIGLAIFTVVSILAVVFFKHRMRNVEHKVNTIFQMIRSYKKGNDEPQENMSNGVENIKINPETNKRTLVVPSSHTAAGQPADRIVVSDDEGGVSTRKTIASHRNDVSGYSSDSDSDESTDSEETDDSREVSDTESVTSPSRLTFRKPSTSIDLADLINSEVNVVSMDSTPKSKSLGADQLIGLLSAQVMEINTKTLAKSNPSKITVEEINEPINTLELHSVEGVSGAVGPVDATVDDAEAATVDDAEAVTVDDAAAATVDDAAAATVDDAAAATVEEVVEDATVTEEKEVGKTKTIVIPQSEPQYSTMKAAELKRIATERGHTKLSRMSKKKLVELLETGASE